MGPTREQYETERKFFTDYWNLRKKYYSAEGESGSWWDHLVDDITAMEKKYTGKYQRDLLTALAADIEHRAREEKR